MAPLLGSIRSPLESIGVISSRLIFLVYLHQKIFLCFRYIHISTRSNEGIRLLLVEPLDLERVIHKSMKAVDTLQAAIDSVEIQVSSDSVHPMLNDTVHPASNNTVHLVSNDIVNLNNVHPVTNDTIHQVSIDTTCGET